MASELERPCCSLEGQGEQSRNTNLIASLALASDEKTYSAVAAQEDLLRRIEELQTKLESFLARCSDDESLLRETVRSIQALRDAQKRLARTNFRLNHIKERIERILRHQSQAKQTIRHDR